MFAAVYIPDLMVAAVVRMEPALRGKAVAVLEGKPPLVRVAAVNELAAETGIEPGMTKLQAEAYAAELRQRSPEQEAAAHAALLDCAQAFSPRVEDTTPDTVVLDIAGLERLFGPAAKLAQDLAARASALGLEANVAVAANPDAAIHAARGFRGVTVIPQGKQAERLGDLPADVLLAPPETMDTLDRWGIRNLRALAALPEVAIVERLGQQGLHLRQLARGAVERPLVPAEPPLSFEESMELEHPVALLEPLAFILGQLLEQLCGRLGARALATNELKLMLGLDGAENAEEVSSSSFLVYREKPVSAEKLKTRNEKHYCLRLPVPMLDSRLFLKLLQLDLRAHPPGAPVMKVTLTMQPVEPRPGQGGLFLPETPAPDRLELMLARLAGIVGKDNIGAAELVDSHRPDAVQMRRFAPAAPQGLKPRVNAAGKARLKPCPDTNPLHTDARLPCPDTKRTADSGPLQANTQLPTMALRRFRPPIAAKVSVREAEPVHISAGEICGEVASLSGPWRTSGDWWKGEHKSHRTNPSDEWTREEWDIALAGKQGIVLYRIYREAHSGAWFVEGSYD